MRTYSLPEGLWLSFYSKRFYQAVAAHWRGAAAAYLCLVLILCGVPGFVRMQAGIHRGLAVLSQQVATKLPTITIVKGELHTPQTIPYEIRFGDAPQEMILIDTSGKTTSLENTTALMLVTKNQVLVRKSPTQSNVYSLAAMKDTQIDVQRINRWISAGERWFPILFYPLFFVIMYLLRFIEALVLALIGLVLVHWMEAKLDLAELLSLAIVALTPSLLYGTLLEISARSFPLQGFINIWLTLGYFLFAMNAATDTPVDPE